MTVQKKIESLLNCQENESLEFKAVLPPSGIIARFLCGFANVSGGTLLLGIDESSGSPVPVGLSRDFHAHQLTSRAISLLNPQVPVQHQYVDYGGVSLYLIEVEKSDEPVSVAGERYLRSGDRVVLDRPPTGRPVQSFGKAVEFSQKLERFSESATEAKNCFIEHYLSVIKIISDLGSTVFSNSSSHVASNQEGKILTRILFSSCADNFEGYLSDLLYEIYLANPNTLKSNEQVTIKDVLDCDDLREFITSWARRKLAKLERGSVKGFLSENKQISDLGVLDDEEQLELERILQIRHLYTHRNGVVDEKFLKYFPDGLLLNDEHLLSVDAMIDYFDYLATTVNRIDEAAITKFQLATLG